MIEKGSVEIIPVKGIPVINKGDNIVKIIFEKLLSSIPDINEDDVIVIAHTILSRAFGDVIILEDVSPSPLAMAIAKSYDKDPRHVQVILDQADPIKISRGIIITENDFHHVAANAGVDRSNAKKGTVILLPKNPDKIAEKIALDLKKLLGFTPRIIISDTLGRTLRKGAINVAIGAYNIPVLKNEIGKKDLFGYELKVTKIAIGDEIASAAELVMGESDEAVPVVVVRGIKSFEGEGIGKDLCREEINRMFK